MSTQVHAYIEVGGIGMCCPLPQANAVHRVFEAALPYDGTSGFSGSATSRDRALRADRTGVTSANQQAALTLLDQMGTAGLTVHELDAAMAWNHHGKSSGVLSVLHKEGVIDRLAEIRDRCEVYVLPEWVNGRETRQHGRKRPTFTDVEMRALGDIEAAQKVGAQPTAPDIMTVTQAIRRVL